MRNMSDEERLQRYRRDFEQTLRCQPLQMRELCKQYLQNNVAKSLLSVVESTFQETMEVSFDELFDTLQKLDQDIYELQVMRKLPNPKKSLYEMRTRYLTMVMPDPELVKHLASESFGDEQLKYIRCYMSKFQREDSLSKSFDEFRVFFRRHRLAIEPGFVESSECTPSQTALGSVESESPQTQGASPTHLRRLFNLGFFWARKFKTSLVSLSTSVSRFTWFVFGFRPKRLSPNLEAAKALDLLRVYVNWENETERLLPVDEAIVSKFTEYIFPASREESSLIEEIKTVINKHIPNMNSSEFASRFCEKIVEEFKSILEIERLEIKKSWLTIRERTSVFSLGRLALSPTPLSWALFWPPLLVPFLVVLISGSVSWFLCLFIGLPLVTSVILGARSRLRARLQLQQKVEEELTKLVRALVKRTVDSTSNHVTLDWISQSVKDIDVELRLRPLQRIFDGSLDEQD